MAREIPADLRPIVEAAVAVARKRLERGEELPALAIVDAPAGEGDNAAVVVPMDRALSKDAWARLVRTISSFAESRFVLFVSEVWINNLSRAELDRLLAEHGEIQYTPGRRVAVLVQIETHDGFWQGNADVIPFAAVENGRTFGAIEFEFPSKMEGRLLGLLAPRPRGD